MTTSIHPLIAHTHRPTTTDELVSCVDSAFQQSTALYPMGGGTSLDLGLPFSHPGAAVDITGLNSVVDYPAADMTITVQAGISMAELQSLLAEHQQQLPLDVPQAATATLGGVLATNFSGPRRFGYGTARDYVIGVRAVDGQGTPFSGGGRVVKNVAGYDFCRLLVGSMGTLGIIYEVTLKLKPLAPHRCALMMAPQSLEQLSRVLAELVTSRTQPTAVEWLRGSDWHCLADQQQWPDSADEVGWLMLLYDGTQPEVEWSVAQLQREWRQSSQPSVVELDAAQANRCLAELTEFPAGDAELVLKGNVRPSRVLDLARIVSADYPDVSLLAHAGNGIVYFRFPTFPSSGWSQSLLRSWQPTAIAADGNLVMLRNRPGQEMTRRAVWGNPSGPVEVMRRIKTAFDPRGILNPDRFIY